MGDRYIHLKEISVDFIKRCPTFDLELVFKNHAGLKIKSNKFKKGDLVRWNLDMHFRTHTSGTLTIRRALFSIRIAEILVEFEPNEFRDDSAVVLEDRNHRVAVNFVCGRSRSLADVTCALGSQTQTTAHVPRFLELPQLAVHIAQSSPTSEQRYSVQGAAVHCLNDDILLDIFNYYRLDGENRWNDRLGWRKLSQVCQRWRCLIYRSTFHLGMRIHCTRGTPIVDTLEYLPPLPLLVDYSATLTRQDELGLWHALWLNDRVWSLRLEFSLSILQKYLMLMDKHFPILEDLRVSLSPDKFTALTLPKAFLAPNLRHLTLRGIGFPKRLRLLTSTVSLVTLRLWDIQASSYFRPRLLVARLGSLPQLEEVHIGFSIPIPRPSIERELLGEQGTPVTLLNLKTLRFQGVSVYLDSFLAQIRAPVLEQLHITLFNQIVFTLQHLSHFINTTGALKFPTAMVRFRNEVTITPNGSTFNGPFFLEVKCKPLDWQIDCAAQICRALLVSDVGLLVLDAAYYKFPIEIDATTWHDLLRLFVGARELHIKFWLLEELSRALQMDGVGSDPWFLPNLQRIVAKGYGFASFIDARRVAGRPVRFLNVEPPSDSE